MDRSIWTWFGHDYADRLIWTGWYGQDDLDRMIRTGWYGQYDFDRMIMGKVVYWWLTSSHITGAIASHWKKTRTYAHKVQIWLVITLVETNPNQTSLLCLHLTYNKHIILTVPDAYARIMCFWIVSKVYDCLGVLSADRDLLSTIFHTRVQLKLEI